MIQKTNKLQNNQEDLLQNMKFQKKKYSKYSKIENISFITDKKIKINFLNFFKINLSIKTYYLLLLLSVFSTATLFFTVTKIYVGELDKIFVSPEEFFGNFIIKNKSNENHAVFTNNSLSKIKTNSLYSERVLKSIELKEKDQLVADKFDFDTASLNSNYLKSYNTNFNINKKFSKLLFTIFFTYIIKSQIIDKLKKKKINFTQQFVFVFSILMSIFYILLIISRFSSTSSEKKKNIYINLIFPQLSGEVDINVFISKFTDNKKSNTNKLFIDKDIQLLHYIQYINTVDSFGNKILRFICPNVNELIYKKDQKINIFSRYFINMRMNFVYIFDNFFILCLTGILPVMGMVFLYLNTKLILNWRKFTTFADTKINSKQTISFIKQNRLISTQFAWGNLLSVLYTFIQIIYSYLSKTIVTEELLENIYIKLIKKSLIFFIFFAVIIFFRKLLISQTFKTLNYFQSQSVNRKNKNITMLLENDKNKNILQKYSDFFSIRNINYLDIFKLLFEKQKKNTNKTTFYAIFKDLRINSVLISSIVYYFIIQFCLLKESPLIKYYFDDIKAKLNNNPVYKITFLDRIFLNLDKNKLYITKDNKFDGNQQYFNITSNNKLISNIKIKSKSISELITNSLSVIVGLSQLKLNLLNNVYSLSIFHFISIVLTMFSVGILLFKFSMSPIVLIVFFIGLGLFKSAKYTLYDPSRENNYSNIKDKVFAKEAKTEIDLKSTVYGKILPLQLEFLMGYLFNVSKLNFVICILLAIPIFKKEKNMLRINLKKK